MTVNDNIKKSVDLFAGKLISIEEREVVEVVRRKNKEEEMEEKYVTPCWKCQKDGDKRKLGVSKVDWKLCERDPDFVYFNCPGCNSEQYVENNGYVKREE